MHAFLRLFLWNISENFSVVLPLFPTTVSQLKGKGTGNEKSIPHNNLKKKTVNNTEAINSEQQACREMWDSLRSKNHLL